MSSAERDQVWGCQRTIDKDGKVHNMSLQGLKEVEIKGPVVRAAVDLNAGQADLIE